MAGADATSDLLTPASMGLCVVPYTPLKSATDVRRASRLRGWRDNKVPSDNVPLCQVTKASPLLAFLAGVYAPRAIERFQWKAVGQVEFLVRGMLSQSV